MNQLSSPPLNRQSASAGQWTDQIQESMQVLLNWIDSVGIQSDRSNQIGRRNAGFTNGPFAEIKELIGTLK